MTSYRKYILPLIGLLTLSAFASAADLAGTQRGKGRSHVTEACGRIEAYSIGQNDETIGRGGDVFGKAAERVGGKLTA